MTIWDTSSLCQVIYALVLRLIHASPPPPARREALINGTYTFLQCFEGVATSPEESFALSLTDELRSRCRCGGRGRGVHPATSGVDMTLYDFITQWRNLYKCSEELDTADRGRVEVRHAECAEEACRVRTVECEAPCECGYDAAACAV